MDDKLLLMNANIIFENGLIEKGKNLIIKNGIISKIQNVNEEINKNNLDIYDCTDKYISPSFVNLHCHSPMNIFKGIAEDVSIEDWFNKKIWPYENNLNEEDIYLSSVFAFLEMINNGVTAVADHYFFEKGIIKASNITGMKLDIAPTIFNNDFDSRIHAIKKIIQNKDNKKVKISLGPHSPYLLDKRILKNIIKYASENKIKIHLHVSETKKQVKESIEKFGFSPFEYLNSLNLFENKVLIAHGLWINEEELKCLSNDTFFAFCPKTYYKLSMGFGNIWKLKNKINFSFGTDGAASSNSLDILEQAKLFSLTGKMLFSGNDFSLNEIWKSLMNGHNFFEFNSGEIKIGNDADLIIWDLDNLNTFPTNDVLASIIYSSNSNNIDSVLISGKFVKKANSLVLPKNYSEIKRTFFKNREKIFKNKSEVNRIF